MQLTFFHTFHNFVQTIDRNSLIDTKSNYIVFTSFYKNLKFDFLLCWCMKTLFCFSKKNPYGNLLTYLLTYHRKLLRS